MDTMLRLLGESRFAFANPYQDVRGWLVRDTAGNDLGHLDDVLIDESAAKVRFLKVAHGGILGFGVSHSFIPIEEVIGVADGRITIQTSAEKIAGAPRFDPALIDKDHPFADKDRHFEDLYSYYGYQAPWAPMPVARLPRIARPSS
jgi:sporulation protein YlmC with PRC-barrel domain